MNIFKIGDKVKHISSHNNGCFPTIRACVWDVTRVSEDGRFVDMCVDKVLTSEKDLLWLKEIWANEKLSAYSSDLILYRRKILKYADLL